MRAVRTTGLLPRRCPWSSFCSQDFFLPHYFFFWYFSISLPHLSVYLVSHFLCPTVFFIFEIKYKSYVFFFPRLRCLCASLLWHLSWMCIKDSHPTKHKWKTVGCFEFLVNFYCRLLEYYWLLNINKATFWTGNWRLFKWMLSWIELNSSIYRVFYTHNCR